MVSLTGKNERKAQMNTNLKTLALALVAGFALIACADESACTPKANDPAPAEEIATAPAAETPVATASESAPAEKKAKRRRTRCAKKDKSATPANGKQKTPRRRRARKMDSAEMPVTGMLDSAE